MQAEASVPVLREHPTSRFRQAPRTPFQAGAIPFALGAMVNAVSLASSGTPEVSVAPEGEAWTEIWPPVAKACFPWMVRVTVWVAAS